MRKMSLRLPHPWTVLVNVLILMSQAITSGATDCDPSCSPQLLTSATMPFPKGVSKVYWWPDDDVQYLAVNTSGAHVLRGIDDTSLRHKWHEVFMTREVSYHGNETFNVISPSLGINQTHECKKSCDEVRILTEKKGFAAIQCQGVPCGCPRQAVNCPHTERAEPNCHQYLLTELVLPTSVPSKFYLKLESTGHLQISWDLDPRYSPNYRNNFDQEIKTDHLNSWMEVQIHSAEEQGSHPLCLSIFDLGIVCQTNFLTGAQIRLKPPSVAKFALDCSEKPQDEVSVPSRRIGLAWITLLIIVLIIGIGVLVFFIVRVKNNRK